MSLPSKPLSITIDPSQYPLIHSCTVAMRWGDMDAYRHLNNAVYFRLMEEARIQMFSTMKADIDPNGISPVLMNAGCTFLRPFVYPDTIHINCYVGDAGRSSFMTYYTMYSEKTPDTLNCEAYSKIVWMDQRTGKSTPLPDTIRQQIVQSHDNS